MRNKMLRSVLVAIFSTVVAVATLSGLSGAKGDARAGDSVWPAGPRTHVLADSVWPAVAADSEGAGS
ncbi:hypothetical protein SAMN04487981_111257 [Streptomyces sp. cf386]|nr:hypothetical protein SAMN04487981_111257 [Streptomyces sp. cf386]